MGLILSTIQSVLDKEGIDYDVVEENDAIVVAYSLNSEKGPIIEKIMISEDREWFSVFGFFQNRVPLDRLEKIYPVLSRINTEKVFTTICVDEEDGELFVRCSCSVDGNVVNDDIVNTAIYAVLHTVDNSYDLVMEAVHGD